MNLTQFLVENRIEFLKQQNAKGIDTSHDRFATFHKPDEIVDHFASYDPTPNKQYTQWMLKQYKAKSIRQEDAPQISGHLELFHKHRARIAEAERDINKHTPQSLAQTVAPFVNNAPVTKGDMKKASREGLETLYSDDKLSVHKLLNKNASIAIYGGGAKSGKEHGTDWCTATDSKYNMYDRYTQRGPLYTIHVKGDPNSPYQFHAHSSQFMDRHDSSIDPLVFATEHPSVSHGLGKVDARFDRLMTNFDDHFEKAKDPNSYRHEGPIEAFLTNPNLTDEHISKIAGSPEVSGHILNALSFGGTRPPINQKLMRALISGPQKRQAVLSLTNVVRRDPLEKETIDTLLKAEEPFRSEHSYDGMFYNVHTDEGSPRYSVVSESNRYNMNWTDHHFAKLIDKIHDEYTSKHKQPPDLISMLEHPNFGSRALSKLAEKPLPGGARNIDLVVKYDGAKAKPALTEQHLLGIMNHPASFNKKMDEPGPYHGSGSISSALATIINHPSATKHVIGSAIDNAIDMMSTHDFGFINEGKLLLNNALTREDGYKKLINNPHLVPHKSIERAILHSLKHNKPLEISELLDTSYNPSSEVINQLKHSVASNFGDTTKYRIHSSHWYDITHPKIPSDVLHHVIRNTRDDVLSGSLAEYDGIRPEHIDSMLDNKNDRVRRMFMRDISYKDAKALKAVTPKHIERMFSDSVLSGYVPEVLQALSESGHKTEITSKHVKKWIKTQPTMLVLQPEHLKRMITNFEQKEAHKQ